MAKAKLGARAAAPGIGSLRRRVFLCAEQSEPNCCTREAGLHAREYLKNRLRAEPGIFRTNANCLRQRRQGPIAVVHPDGVWHRGATAEVLARIVEEHLTGGRPVEEHTLGPDPLRGPGRAPEPR